MYCHLKPHEFWELTYQEFYVLTLGFLKEQEDKRIAWDEKLFFFGDLKAHIANFNPWIQRLDKKEWTYKDFFKLSTDKEEKKEKLTLKKAKQTLGSRFIINQN